MFAVCHGYETLGLKCFVKLYFIRFNSYTFLLWQVVSAQRREEESKRFYHVNVQKKHFDPKNESLIEHREKYLNWQPALSIFMSPVQ